MKIFGGVEGGSSHTTIVLVNEKGEELSRCFGGPTNQWLLGIEKTAEHLKSLIDEAYARVEGPKGRISCVCLSLSGIDEELAKKKLRRELMQRCDAQDLVEELVMINDSFSVLPSTRFDDGIVLIAGTGTVALGVDADGKMSRKGGYGHLLGDEGSAYTITYTGIKKALALAEGRCVEGFNIGDEERFMELFNAHFQISSLHDILTLLYSNFEKARIASFTKIAAQAAEEGDKFCASLFSDAGADLGYLISGIMREHIGAADINVVCCGSVFKSFHMMRDSFGEAVQKCKLHLGADFKLHLHTLRDTCAFGACLLAARKCQVDLHYDLAEKIIEI